VTGSGVRGQVVEQGSLLRAAQESLSHHLLHAALHSPAPLPALPSPLHATEGRYNAGEGRAVRDWEGEQKMLAREREGLL
jgi:hypothetical protein